MAGRYGLPTNLTFSKIIYFITMLLPCISINFLLFFCYHYFVHYMHTYLVFTFILQTDHLNINSQPQKSPPDEDQKVETRRGLHPIKQQLQQCLSTLQFFFLHTSLTAPIVHLLPQFLRTPPCHSIVFHTHHVTHQHNTTIPSNTTPV